MCCIIFLLAKLTKKRFFSPICIRLKIAPFYAGSGIDGGRKLKIKVEKSSQRFISSDVTHLLMPKNVALVVLASIRSIAYDVVAPWVRELKSA